MILAAVLLAGTTAAAPPAGKVRVSVLKIKSSDTPPEELAALSDELTKKLAATDGVTIVDAVAPLVEKGADEWLRADKLLYDGIQDYGDLKFDSAVEKLSEAVTIGESTFREYADAQGPRRLREAYLYLGLSKLEQGDELDATEWFKRAARVDPTFEPDERDYPPAARAKYEQVRADVAQSPTVVGRETLEPLAEKVGADVIVAGRVTHGAGGDRALEIVIDDRWKARLSVESVPIDGDTANAVSALDLEMPNVTSHVLDRSYDPFAVATRRISAGFAMLSVAPAHFRGSVPGNGSPYDVRRGASLGGLAIEAMPIRRGGYALRAHLSIYPLSTDLPVAKAQPPSTTTFQPRVVFAFRLGGLAVREWQHGPWNASAGVGAAAQEVSYGIAAPSWGNAGNVAAYNPVWISPMAGLSGAYHFGRAGFVQLSLEGQYDGAAVRVSSEPAASQFSLESVAQGGVSF